MKILFLHRDFPGQFKFLIMILKAIGCEIYFVTEEKNINISGINKFTYTVNEKPNPTDSFIVRYENILKHAKAASDVVYTMKQQGFKPDLIYGFSPWGLHLYLKEMFFDVPIISYCEWFYNPQGADIGFDDMEYSYEKLAELRFKNSNFLVDLYSSDYCISPTHWQKKQFPVEYQNKIKVIHDGVDCSFHKPDEKVEFQGFTKKDEIVTYVARGFEKYRGFPQFAKAMEIILEKRPNAHILIAGSDKIFYGSSLKKESYLKDLKLDKNRVHFLGILPPVEYAKLLQISSCHIYLTYPFILSWSFIEALSSGCSIVGSNTEPVKEVIKDNENGLLADFFCPENIAQKACKVLEDKELSKKLSENARKTALENYDIKIVMPKHVDMINEIIQRRKS